jgi:hypothetical protein
MKITRKEAIQLTIDITENIMQNGYEYWVYFKGQCIPFDKAMDLLSQFISNPALVSVDITVAKKDKKDIGPIILSDEDADYLKNGRAT